MPDHACTEKRPNLLIFVFVRVRTAIQNIAGTLFSHGMQHAAFADNLIDRGPSKSGNHLLSKKVKYRWQRKKLQIQGAQILSDDSYLLYFEETKDAAQRRSWTFYEAIII
ncbi:MAG: hypothetical protein HF978_05830 [Desulfobacteraceae bacterium]|nr:hypothetical protein [Desulfobacteraceae bacterium]MBC2755053.1 hypothetical protein [Desulfobacteraceae bacterium]